MLAIASIAVIATPPAGAITDAEELTRFGGSGSGAGQLGFSPDDIATDPTTGHVYVTHESRIDEFTPWGDFVKAFGWDVAPGAVNEQQEARVKASGGQFRLAFGASTTPDLTLNAPGSESEGPGSVEAALNALPSIDGVGGQVTVKAVPGPADGFIPSVYVVAFEGSLAATDVAQLTIVNGTSPLSGGVPTTTLEVRTRADGTAGGTGLESCTIQSGCKAGLDGTGPGQFDGGVDANAVDTAGNVYIKDSSRVQKFDFAGRFILMFGGEVNKTKSVEVGSTEAERNRCTKAQLDSGDVCGIGTIGVGQGQFGAKGGRGMAFGPTGKLFVADVERIQRFNVEGEYETAIPVAGKVVQDLAIASGSGDFYVSVEVSETVRKLDPAAGAEIDQLGEPGELTATYGPLATDPFGNVFVQGSASPRRILQFDSGGNRTSEFGEVEPSFQIRASGTNATGGVYVAYTKPGVDTYVRIFGPAPATFEAPPLVAPEIVGQFATTVERTSAVLATEINPRFWTNTRYYVEYGTGKCSEGGCEETKPVPPGAILSSKVTGQPLRSAGILLEGLQPNTTYHYRFVAESSGGGPVRGIGGEVGADGEESTFVTYPLSALPKTDCPNQSFRTGPSASLPGCRAYEMVSPIDKNNGDIRTLLSVGSLNTALSQSAPDGSRFTYSSYRGFADTKAAVYTNQYLATRAEGVGWSSESLEVGQESHLSSDDGFIYGDALENHSKAFTADLCKSWLMLTAEPPPAPGASEGYRNIYRRDNCGQESLEALIQVAPNVSRGPFYPIVQGNSADGKAAIFMVEDQLAPGAAGGGAWQAYYASDGALTLLCVLPSGAPSGGKCSAGTSDNGGAPPGLGGSRGPLERFSNLTHAISNDAGKVYWTDTAGKELGPGKVYLRLNPGEEQSAVEGGVCSELEKACTVKVSETVTSQPSRFLGASADGSRALFEVTAGALARNLYKFDAESGTSTLLAGDVRGVAAASEDLSRVYFASEEALAGAAVAGEPNLYLDQEGTKTFITTTIATTPDSFNTDSRPIFHAARATPDGSHFVFISSESLTGYDNIDQLTGLADAEIYLYEVGAAGPVCVSCNPSGARPVGRLTTLNGGVAGLQGAASLPFPETSLYSPRIISDDGEHLFFNSYDALLVRDTNGKADVYEWEAASSQEDCDSQGAELYVPSSGGCLSLISSGQSPQDSELLDSSANGQDVFFATNASLLPQDPDLVDVYDARMDGGLPPPPEPPGPCQGEACQFAPPPPNDPTPASAAFKGAGNFKPRRPNRCAKSKTRRKGRCVAKKNRKQKSKRRTNRNLETSR